MLNWKIIVSVTVLIFLKPSESSESCKTFNLAIDYMFADTEELKDEFGCEFKCEVEKSKVYKDQSWNFGDNKRRDIMKECVDQFTQEHDCRYFYNVYECFDKARNPLKQFPRYQEIVDSKKCNVKRRVDPGVSINEMGKVLMGEEEICYFRELGLFVDGDIKSENVYEGMKPILRKFVMETFDFCEEETKKLFSSKKFYSSLYFFEFRKCYFNIIADWK